MHWFSQFASFMSGSACHIPMKETDHFGGFRFSDFGAVITFLNPQVKFPLTSHTVVHTLPYTLYFGSVLFWCSTAKKKETPLILLCLEYRHICQCSQSLPNYGLNLPLSTLHIVGLQRDGTKMMAICSFPFPKDSWRWAHKGHALA